MIKSKPHIRRELIKIADGFRWAGMQSGQRSSVNIFWKRNIYNKKMSMEVQFNRLSLQASLSGGLTSNVRRL